ncbi:putative quinol monooxygenase [Pacificoceanicola onchidii]|uniref:putative quinol monooxygenase n=1 Tax=Pacificoceanicola onchidii TaxID=2562685 RepID=UPI0010A2F1FF|nr:putative quinol monooxygenase [Pacificoceanicola onchidii]
MLKFLKAAACAVAVTFPVASWADTAGAAFSEAATAVLDTAGYAVVATFKVKEGEVERFAEEMKINEAASRMEPGILDYRSYQDPKTPTLFVNFEAYKDQQAFDDHVATPHVQRLLPILEDILTEPIGIQVLVNY